MSEKTTRPSPTHSGNQGIIGNVTAEVVAVGPRATAIKNAPVPNLHELSLAVADLQSALTQLNLPPHASTAMGQDLKDLTEAAHGAQPNPDRIGSILRTLAGKLQMIGVVLTKTVTLIEPVRKIAEALHVPLSHFGLG